MKRSTALGFAFFAFAALLSSVSSAQSQQTPLKIGFIGELSGPVALVGQDQYDGFMLFVEAHGGKLGGIPVDVIKEDSQFKPEVAVQLVKKLIERDHVPIITGVSFSNIMAAIHRPVTEKGVFLISSIAGPSSAAGDQCSRLVYVTSFEVEMIAEAYAEYANSRGFKSVYLMAPNFNAGKDTMKGFKRVYKGKILNEVYTPIGQIDFAAELTQLAAAKPDAVFAFYAGSAGVNFVRQYQQLGLLKSIPLMSQAAVESGNLRALQDVALGVLSNIPWSQDLDNPANKKFVSGFEAKYKRIPTMAAAFSYDAAQLLDAALRTTGGNVTDKKAFMRALHYAKFPSVRGEFKFANNNFPIQDYYIQEVARDGKGRVNMKTIATPLKQATDPYAAKCTLKWQ